MIPGLTHDLARGKDSIIEDRPAGAGPTAREVGGYCPGRAEPDKSPNDGLVPVLRLGDLPTHQARGEGVAVDVGPLRVTV